MFTNKILKKILLSLILSFFLVSASAQNGAFPFTDIKETDELYKDLSLLYKNNVIKDTPDGKYHPDSLITRDEFLGIVIGVGCKDCINPTTEDFIKYDTPPFIDLTKFNGYYYCISEGKAKGITQGYILDAKGEYTCQNNKTFTSTPFCPENNTTRIEAVAMLIRIANIDPAGGMVKVDITDVKKDDPWYNIANRGIELGLLKQDGDGKIFPNQFLNKREFIHMATKIFGINFCDANMNKNKTGLSSDIKIFDKNNKDSCSGKGKETTFSNPAETTYDFHAYTEDKGDLEYLWEFTNVTTNQVIQASGPCLDNYTLTDGKWIIKLTIRDKTTGATSVSYSQIDVNKSGDKANAGLSTDITADPILGEGPLTVNFDSTITGAKGGVIYVWDFGDGTTSNVSSPTHVYAEPGFYPVTLKVIDADGNTGISQLTVEIVKTIDTDKDGTKDSVDKCPTIPGPATNGGCPIVDEYKKGTDPKTTGNEDISSLIKVFDKSNPSSCDGAGNLTNFSNQTETIYDFYGYTESVGNFEYIWEFTNTTTNEVIKVTGKCVDNFDFKTNGVWNVKVTIRDKDSGKESVSTSQITITDKPTTDTINKMTVALSAVPIQGNAPLTIDFKSIVDGAVGAAEYFWTFGDGQTSTLKNPKHIYKTGGPHTALLNVTDSKGNKGDAQTVIVVKLTANEDISSVIKVFDKDSPSSCDGAGNLSNFTNPKETVYDFYGYTESVGNFEYIWEFTNTTTKEVIKLTGKCQDNFDFKTNGIWEVKLTIRDKNTGSESVSITQITVTDKPATDTGNKVSVNIDANPIVGTSPLPIDFSSLINGAVGDVTYLWTFGDGQTSNKKDPSHSYLAAGAHTVLLTVTDSKGNKGEAQVVIVIKPNSVIPYIVKDDGINNLCLSQKAKGKGTIDGLLQCNSCPCSFSLDYISTITACDIVFPAISSPDKKILYSRGAVYQVK